MNDSLYIAATGMQMHQKSVDTIANNLANVSTPGFKKGRVSFEDMVYRDLSGHAPQGEGALPAQLWQGTGVGLGAVLKSFAPGEMKKTGQVLDVAIQGDGFLEVLASDGSSSFFRGGTLIVDRDGFLAQAEGQVLKPAIHVGADAREVTIQADGRVLVRQRDGAEAFEAGRIELVRFPDVSGLVAQGGNLFRPSARSGEAIYGRAGEDGVGTLAQGFVEMSNVSLVEEMVDLMAAQRAYESSVKVIQASDEMLAMSNNLRK